MSYLFFKKDLKKRCYRCADDHRKDLSDDHLPPKNIFPKEERTGLQLITATICEKCKKLYQRTGEDDQVFIQHMRLWASLRTGGKDTKDRIEDCIKRDRLAKHSGIVLVEDLKITSSDGLSTHYPILKEGRPVILGVLDSIARGFYYRIKGEIIPQQVNPEFEFRPRGSFQPPFNLLTRMPTIVVKEGVFKFAMNFYSDNKLKFLCWEFGFYNLNPLPVYYCYCKVT